MQLAAPELVVSQLVVAEAGSMAELRGPAAALEALERYSPSVVGCVAVVVNLAVAEVVVVESVAVAAVFVVVAVVFVVAVAEVELVAEPRHCC